MRRSLVATLEGLSGVIPAALPVSLRQPYQDDLLLHWGPMTLITAVVTVPVSVTPETVCADTFKHWLLVRPARAESALSPQR
jgi:NhaP-type Na+/H+ or K+/H+ antiporter